MRHGTCISVEKTVWLLVIVILGGWLFTSSGWAADKKEMIEFTEGLLEAEVPSDRPAAECGAAAVPVRVEGAPDEDKQRLTKT